MQKKRFVYAIALIFSISMCACQSITLTKRQLCDLEMILNGGFAPLTGFMNQKDYTSVVENMRLTDGTVWPMPITLDIPDEGAKKIQTGDCLQLCDSEGTIIATMQVDDVYQPDKEKEAQEVFKTTSIDHPSVSYLFEKMGNYYVGGTVIQVNPIVHYDFRELRHTPEELKHYFKDNNIEQVVAFQTRNPMHRAHQELTIRASQEHNAHLLIHPVVGMTKPGDIDYVTRIACYKALLKVYPKGTATVSLLPIAMRMAGPREALWHAIIRKNYGCTHFIIGRDHAGPGTDRNGNYFYGPYDAQDLVHKYAQEIGIQVVPFKEMVYVKEYDSYMQFDEVPQGATVLRISGTQLRLMLKKGENIPNWFTYPEINMILQKQFPKKSQQGFTLFLTGLSASGKSTIARALQSVLMEKQDRKITLLDGDIVRQNLSKGLGFSKEDRSINVRRVGFVAKEITKHGGIAICALIAPYCDDRLYNRNMIGQEGGYVQIYVATPLSECERRDPKGLYEKARSGEIANFTGISDPYQEPQVSEIVVDTTDETVNQVIAKIVYYLHQVGYIV